MQTKKNEKVVATINKKENNLPKKKSIGEQYIAMIKKSKASYAAFTRLASK